MNEESEKTQYDGITITSNTIEVKMRAIEALAKSNFELAKAISSINTNVTVENCTITGGNPGIKIGG